MNEVEQKSPKEFDHNVAWKSKRTAEDYDEKRFSSVTGRLFNYLEQKAIHRCLDTVDECGSNLEFLDIPCGTGRITKLLVKRGYAVTAGDVSQEMLEVARKQLFSAENSRLKFQEMDIYSLECADKSFDCVTCIRLFQHLTSKERISALKELERVSKRYVIVNATYTSMYYGMIRYIRKTLRRYAPRYTISEVDMREELSAANLRLVRRLFPQCGYNGNMVLLLEKGASSE